MDLRIALTVLPVGPRGPNVLDANATGSLWFALQISAGFSEAHDAAAIDTLWPWVLHVVNADKIALRAWVIPNTGAPTGNDHDADVVPVDDFIHDLRKKIVDIYSDANLRRELDLRLLLPGEIAADEKEDHERASFPARVQYLATLPGELSRRLLATVYVKIPTAELFTKTSGTWQPKGKTLWIAPKSVNGSAVISFTSDPVRDGDFHKLTKPDGGTQIVAIGPGFKLADFIAPRTRVFNLETYDVAVDPGDRRYVELETLLLTVLDPFAELHAARGGNTRERVTLHSISGASRVIDEDAFDALINAWRVRAFADALIAAFPKGLEELVTLLLPKNEPRPTLVIPERWSIAFPTELADPDVVNLAANLATRIGLPREQKRNTLRRVSERAGFMEIARLLVQAFDETLSATPGLTKAFLAAWRFGDRFKAPELAERRATLALAAVTHLRERGDVPLLLPDLQSAVLISDDAEEKVRGKAKALLEERWRTKRTDPMFSAALATLELATRDERIQLATDLRKDLANDYVESVWPGKIEPTAELPGRGLTLRLGEKAQRFVHEDNADADGALSSPYRDVAGVMLLARRGIDATTDLRHRPWRVLTGGAALIGELGDRLFVPDQIADKEWLHQLLPLPLRPVFHQKVARADVEYHGQPMLAQSALDHAYAAGDYLAETADGPAPAYSFHPLGNFIGVGGMAEAAKASRVPALRYGDVYEFRGGVIDQAGGLSARIADAATPWCIDFTKLSVDEDPSAPMTYRRSVPPGEVNVLPGIDPNVKSPWPALPDDVALRARELWAIDHADAESLPALLLHGALPEYSFRIVSPVIDEQTLIRWAVPALDDANGAAAIVDLQKALTELFEERSAQKTRPLHDPAVASVGVRIRAAGSDNKIVEILKKTIVSARVANKPFLQEPVKVRVRSASFVSTATAAGDETGIEIVLPEGSFAILEVFPLVKQADYDARFIKLDKLIVAESPFAGHVAFQPTVVLAESATAELPTPKELYERLALALEPNGDIAVRFDGSAIDKLVFADRFAIERDRWVWRNLPVVPVDSLDDVHLSAAERRRLAVSGPTDDLFKDAATRDTSPAVGEWDRIASIDRGFADRGEIAGRWPRLAPVAPFAGGPGIGVRLASDNRDAVSAADYLRFGLRVRSRYAGVLTPKQREVRASLNGSSRRRIVAGFRGQKVKPPKILGIVPLTASLGSDPLKTPPGVTPFLVLLDESFFREYGIGERLDVQLSLENLDIGEDPDAKLPYRAGALPDHWLRSRAADADPPYFRGKLVKTQENEANPIALDLFGPFGYSLDLTPSEALANASAFVVYPPKEVNAHWAMFVRLRRLLDRPSGGQASEFSDVHALYTLPDVRLLASGDEGSMQLKTSKAALKNLRLILDPTAKPGDARKNSEASSQYRYFLLVSRVVTGAGQGFDAEIPAGLWRIPLFKPVDGYQRPTTYDVEFRTEIPIEPLAQDNGVAIQAGDKAEHRGRIIEILINGRYEPKVIANVLTGASRIDTAMSWTEFWKLLLEDKATDEVDAAGMIRRVSQAFPVIV